jgi:hypothetical protein
MERKAAYAHGDFVVFLNETNEKARVVVLKKLSVDDQYAIAFP